MIKRMLTAASVTLILSSGFAQTNTVYLELFGNALLASINYDRMVTDNVSVRVGYGSISLDDTDVETGIITKISITPIPITANYLMGSGNHKLEIGAGILYIMVDGNIDFGGVSLAASGSVIATTGVLGYRYHRDTGGFSFRATVAPIMLEGEMLTMPGLSLGYTF